MSGYEVEAKAKIRDASAAQRMLEEAGYSFLPPVVQVDTVYTRSRADILGTKPGACVARIRREGKRAILNVKRHRTNELDVVEHQTEVSSPDEAAKILIELGLNPQVVVTKTRATATRNELSICIDKVDGLGDFIEVESLTADEPTIDLQARLQRQIVALLNGEVTEIVEWGYDRLLLTSERVEP